MKLPRIDGALMSFGSIAHFENNGNETACKPCAFYNHERKHCRNGVLCKFCHCNHARKQRIRLSKNKRNEAKALIETLRYLLDRHFPIPEIAKMLSDDGLVNQHAVLRFRNNEHHMNVLSLAMLHREGQQIHTSSNGQVILYGQTMESLTLSPVHGQMGSPLLSPQSHSLANPCWDVMDGLHQSGARSPTVGSPMSAPSPSIGVQFGSSFVPQGYASMNYNIGGASNMNYNSMTHQPNLLYPRISSGSRECISPASSIHPGVQNARALLSPIYHARSPDGTTVCSSPTGSFYQLKCAYPDSPQRNMQDAQNGILLPSGVLRWPQSGNGQMCEHGR